MSDWEPGWAALARATKARRDRLRISQSEVERRGGPSTATQRKIERQYADNISSEALFQMDDGLGWWKGTSQAIVDGDIGLHMMSFAEYVEDAINDTKVLRNRGIHYPVQSREPAAQAPRELAAVDPNRPLALYTDAQLTTELANRLAELRRQVDAQEQEPQQGTRGSSDSRAGDPGAPIAPSTKSMDQLRRLNGEDTERSRDDPKSG